MAQGALEAAEAQLKEGAALPALQTLASALEHSSDEALYLTAARALIKAAEGPALLKAWDGFDTLARKLLHHAPCPAPMLTLAHEAASFMTSGNPDAIHALTEVLADVVKSELDSDPAQNPHLKNVLVFALTTRALAGDWLDQDKLSRLHLELFEQFTPEDTALPYSVMFNPDLFGQNRDELLGAYWPKGDTSKLHQLPPDRVLFFSWLACRDAFDDPQTLSTYLDRFLPDETHAPAARALVLRSGAGLDPAQLKAWGLGALAPLVPAPQRRLSPNRTGASLIDKKPYQALQAGLHRYAPALAGRRKLRVAICLSGQLRGYEAACETWRAGFLRSIDPVFFIHSWEGIGRSDAQPFRYVLPFEGARFCEAYREVALSLGYEAMQARHPSLYAALGAGNSADAEALKALYKTPHVVLEDDKGPKFDGFTNQHKMHYKIHAADKLAREAGEFDLHMRIRPDLATGLVGFNWADLRDASAAHDRLFAEKPYGLHYDNLMIGDQCAVATPEVMARYAGTWEHFPKLAQAGLARCPDNFTGHVSLALSAWTQGLDVARLPMRFGTLQDASPLPAPDILRALEADSRNDAQDQRLLDAISADLGSV
ncbi:MAG: hypothetical protein AAF825_10680 [Pseudomonadota bacterium]